MNSIKHLSLLTFLWMLGHTTLHAQGLNFNDTSYNNVLKKKSSLVVNEDGLPPKVDLSMYVPSVLNQGSLGTCVGFSTAYYMRTILEAKRLNITNKDSIDALRFSPSFLYNAIKSPNDDACKKGAEVSNALEFLKTNGVARLAQQGYPDCTPMTSLQPAAESKIMDYIRLFGLNDRQEDIVVATKKALAEGTPVVIAIQTTPSLDELGFWHKLWMRILRFFGIGSGDEYGLWDPNKSDNLRGGHAVCVVGYDDKKFGGAFHVVNSRGEDWGEDGFFWIRYDDYTKHTKYGFQAYLSPNNYTTEALRSGDVTIELANLRPVELPFTRQSPEGNTAANEPLVAYSLRDPQQTDTEYKFRINVDKQTYLYVLGANATQPSVDKLFPIDSISPVVGANTKVFLPSEEQVYALNEITGTESWLFLFSDKEVNIDSCITAMNGQKGTFTQRVQKVMGSKLLNYEQIDYKTKKMGFELREKHEGRIVPLLITLEHVKRRDL